ncbi:PREDICTED: LOW QUALITY PROTEIN: asparagine--tRNA ligase, cytoplasmic 1 [Camelina sativa]|uniref:LOW QUALITY PROTEIN: asparagine--tRNA ligase, cytoplasmic 1 n=1 Tax=Camelina sativa TaxID=90675 RepID=A0ABM0ZP85_CAMSA|nr:PREDICTED: LOW QUALITY PROTEIN: asparagine--tRNA ligase, cytoplasmic 1 [Camelina sativa]
MVHIDRIPSPNKDGASSSTVQKSPFSSRTRIRWILDRPDDGAGLAGQKVQISGWVKSGREQGKGTFAFLEVNDGTCAANLQIKVDASVVHSHLSKLVATGTSLTVDGCLKLPPQGKDTKQKIELSAEKVTDVGTVDPVKYPIHKKKLTLEHLRDHTNFRARTTTMAAVTRIRREITLFN